MPFTYWDVVVNEQKKGGSDNPETALFNGFLIIEP